MDTKSELDKINTKKAIVLTNQVLDYNDCRDIPRLENVDKMPKPNLRINLSISSDLGIAIFKV